MTAASGWPTRWTYYATVPPIDGMIQGKSGWRRDLQGPHEVPGGALIMLGADQRGVAFALSGGK